MKDVLEKAEEKVEEKAEARAECEETILHETEEVLA